MSDAKARSEGWLTLIDSAGGLPALKHAAGRRVSTGPVQNARCGSPRRKHHDVRR